MTMALERPQRTPSELLPASSVTNRLPNWVVLPVMALGLAFRLWDIGQPYIGLHMWNEIYYVTIARNFDHYGPFLQYNYLEVGGRPLSPVFGPTPLVPWMVWVSSHFLGNTEWVARLPILLLGLLALSSLYLIARELYDFEIALLSVFFAAVMPGAVFFSRQVALDGPMAAFGLAAFLFLLFFRRLRQYRWLVASSVLFALSIMAKYTAVLFAPALLLVWVQILWRGDSRTRRGTWTLATSYFILSVLPAAAWFAFSASASSTLPAGRGSVSYLDRFSEMNPRAYFEALQVGWLRLAEQTGPMLWYPLVVALAIASAFNGLRQLAEKHLEVILLVLPWFAQIIYPFSWSINDAYSFPPLYGIAILLALFAREGFSRVRQMAIASERRVLVIALSLLVLVLLSSLVSYKRTYRWWYHPDWVASQQLANAITPYDPFSSALLVRSVNVDHRSILADLPSTLYYAKNEDWLGRATYTYWWFPGELDLALAYIENREFNYVVFTYQPPVDILEALVQSGYRRIAPGAWERASDS